MLAHRRHRLGQRARLLERVEAGPGALGAVAGDAIPHLVVGAFGGRNEQAAPPSASARVSAKRLLPERAPPPIKTRRGAGASRHALWPPSRDRFGTTTTTGMRVPRISRSFS